ncbi:hypothetical protein BDD43_4889 [Mucilaginibacter gracilis]|uniref:Uncharacterized protein n=1 Tax=Mucilaginibacter gracilis TaxID=423350 RepID=A0A495J7C9_9SPHI|nr:hypothetical protein [Mucilaginibacter gracilis]RKR84641.1 hypothetical protein BDD43_4889 [Mucilaginibacter gracilis]
MILEYDSYIVLSEQLRGALELSIDILYAQNRFCWYVIVDAARFSKGTQDDHLCACMLDQWLDSQIPSEKVPGDLYYPDFSLYSICYWDANSYSPLFDSD